MELLDEFGQFYKELPFADNKQDGLRYYYNNDMYGCSDAICLYCMLRYLKPEKIIEIGSGFSSAVTLDTNELFLRNAIKCTFIEPYPERLLSLLKENDKKCVKIFEKRLQEIPLELFKELSENDILFIDSTHVSKFDSDVNYILSTILPVLAEGVYIHFHDIFSPFEYPGSWLLAGRAWNEAYMLRAFLEYNNSFKIALFNTYLQTLYKEELLHRFPLLYNSRIDVGHENIGASIWIKKINR
jgi:DNA replicative helicase MCM subunit Mcm2 (Cdc46/Mcm family)